jgi:hypothetical protein
MVEPFGSAGGSIGMRTAGRFEPEELGASAVVRNGKTALVSASAEFV